MSIVNWVLVNRYPNIINIIIRAYFSIESKTRYQCGCGATVTASSRPRRGRGRMAIANVGERSAAPSYSIEIERAFRSCNGELFRLVCVAVAQGRGGGGRGPREWPRARCSAAAEAARVRLAAPAACGPSHSADRREASRLRNLRLPHSIHTVTALPSSLPRMGN